jgi:hypothetical protein
MPTRDETAKLVVQYMRADANMRRMLRLTLPSVFTDELDVAVVEADAMLSEAEEVSQDAAAVGQQVYADMGFPTTDGILGPRAGPTTRELFELTLAQMIVEQLEDDDDGIDDADASSLEAGGNRDKLFTVLAQVGEFAEARGAVALSGVCKLWRHCVVTGPHAKAMWLGIAMREFGEAARTVVATNGPEALWEQDWREFVLQHAGGSKR